MTIFVSDLHLGHPMCKADRLLNFIANQNKNQTIYLVGDAIDDAAPRQWPSDHVAVVGEILTFPRIIYLPGNHDDCMSAVIGLWGRVVVFEHGFYKAGDRKYFVTHGHRYDPSLALVAPRWFRRTVPCTGRIHTKMLSGFLKGRAVSAVKKIGCDGVICGHTHHPEHDLMDDGFEYLNCGDWFYSCSAIVEHGGEFKLITV